MTFAVAAATAATAMVTVAAAASGPGSDPAAAKMISGVSASGLDRVGVAPAYPLALNGHAAPAGGTSGQPAVSAHSPSNLRVAGHARGDAVTVTARQAAAKGRAAPAPKNGPAAQLAPAKHAGPAKHAAPVKHAAPPRLTHPYTMYDSVTPSAIPAHQPAAVYATGPYAASQSQVRGLGHAIWIDTMGTDYSASALDVEPGDATPSQAANWVQHRLEANPHAVARVYTMRSWWSAAQAAIATLPQWMQARVHWWIADPTGVPHILPGADATQWSWGTSYDISSVRPGF